MNPPGTDPQPDPNGHLQTEKVENAGPNTLLGKQHIQTNAIDGTLIDSQSNSPLPPPSNPSSEDSTKPHSSAHVASNTENKDTGQLNSEDPPLSVSTQAPLQAPLQGSTRPCPNDPPPPSQIYPFQFADLKEGEFDPTLGNKVKWLISSDDNFIVYISEDDRDDKELYVEWNMNDTCLLKQEAGPYLNRVGQLEAVDISRLSKLQITSYKRMIAEGVARLFENNFKVAGSALDLAETWITARNTEIARGWYLFGSGLIALASAFVIAYLGNNSQTLRVLPYFDLILGTAFGGLGAWLSVIQRSRTAGLDVAAGPMLHYLEGAFRIMAGSLGALLVAMATRAGLFIQTNRLSALMVMCMVAGVSERLVPSFIEQMESRTSGQSTVGKASGEK